MFLHRAVSKFHLKRSLNSYKAVDKLNWYQYIQKKSFFKPRTSGLNRWTLTKEWVFFFGNSIISLPCFIYLSLLNLIKFTLNLKRVVKKTYRTLRRYWITLRVLIRIKRHSKGARMGKGKGKNISLMQKISPFTNFIEFRGIRLGRLLLFLKFFNSRFPFNLFGVFGNYSWLTSQVQFTFKRY